MSAVGTSDILVIGAGPAGSAAAISAARAGARVCLVDKAHFPRQKTCGDAIPNAALHIARSLAGEDGVARVRQATVRGAAAIFPGGSRVRRSYGSEPGLIVERIDFDDLLRRAAEREGVDVREGVTIRRLIRNGDHFDRAEGPGFEWKAGAIIVADGTASLAWNALGLPPPGATALGISATAYYEQVEESSDAGYSEHFFEKYLPTGYAWIFPPVEGRSNVGVYLRVDRYRSGAQRLPELMRRFVEANPARFRHARACGVTRTWSLPLATFRGPPCAPGLLTCGDAARLIDPLTGEGIWHAMHTGCLAGAASASALGASGLDEAAVRNYWREVRRTVSVPTALRRGLEAAATFVVKYDFHRSRALRRALEWGYNQSRLEVSKTTNFGRPRAS